MALAQANFIKDTLESMAFKNARRNDIGQLQMLSGALTKDQISQFGQMATDAARPFPGSPQTFIAMLSPPAPNGQDASPAPLPPLGQVNGAGTSQAPAQQPAQATQTPAPVAAAPPAVATPPAAVATAPIPVAASPAPVAVAPVATAPSPTTTTQAPPVQQVSPPGPPVPGGLGKWLWPVVALLGAGGAGAAGYYLSNNPTPTPTPNPPPVTTPAAPQQKWILRALPKQPTTKGATP